MAKNNVLLFGMKAAHLLVATSVLFFLSACSVLQAPDLVRIYEKQASQNKVPIIFIPGIMGSQLKNKQTGELVWPGSTFDLLFGGKFEKLALPINGSDILNPSDELVPSGLFMTAAGTRFYASIVETLETAGGYQCVDIDELTAESDCVLMAWDWRKDLVIAAKQLDILIMKIRDLRENPDLKVDIVAHSAGGLITRYYSRFGGEDVLNSDTFNISYSGGEKVRKAILIGTPNYGSISALQQAIMGSPIILTRIEPEVLATMPSIYQLFPHPERSWMVDVYGQRIELDLFELDTWKEKYWSIFDPKIRGHIAQLDPFMNNKEALATHLDFLEGFMDQSLQRGKRFHQALSIASDTAPNKFIVLGASCVLTPARCLLETVDGKDMVRLFPDEVVNRVEGINYDYLMLEAGDGSVTKASLLARDSLNPVNSGKGTFPIAYEFFVCDEHSHLAENITFRDNLLNILLN